MSERKVYAICDTNCRYETLTKEEIYAAIMQAVQSGSIGDVDTGFITTVKTINGKGLKFFVGEQHEYEALTAEQKEGLFAIITNDTTKDGVIAAITELAAKTDTQEKWRGDVMGGATAVPKAEAASGLAFTLCKTHDYTHTDAGVRCDLDYKTVYFVKVKGGAEVNYREMHFVLPVGTAETFNASNLFGAGKYLYRLLYTQNTIGGVTVNCLYLERVNYTDTTAIDFAGFDTTAAYNMSFYKIAGYPS